MFPGSRRTRVREDGFYRRIVPPVQISQDDMDREVITDEPVRVVSVENGPAMSVPFGTLPINVYIRGPRHRVMFDRMVTPQFNGEDVTEIGKKKPISIPFATYPREERRLGCISTPRFSADVEELTHWDMDIREVLASNPIRDRLTDEDQEFIDATSSARSADDGLAEH